MITYNVFGEHFLLEEFSGRVNEREFVSLKRTELEQTDYFSISGIVMDFRKLKVQVTKKIIRNFIGFLVRNQHILANKSIAILTKTMEQLNFSYLLRELLDTHAIPVQVQHFSSKQAAFTWLSAAKK